jgi:hypothetical protein
MTYQEDYRQLTAGKSPKRRQRRKKQGDFEEVPRLAGMTMPACRLARRWADMDPAPRVFYQ